MSFYNSNTSAPAFYPSVQPGAWTQHAHLNSHKGNPNKLVPAPVAYVPYNTVQGSAWPQVAVPAVKPVSSANPHVNHLGARRPVAPEEYMQVNPGSKRWVVPVAQQMKGVNNKKKGSAIEDEIQTQNLYKTELCRSFEETGTCRYGAKCQFAHGKDELRPVLRHPKYKTEVCKTFHTIGTCPYGKRCRFIHSTPDEYAASRSAAAASVVPTWTNDWPQQHHQPQQQQQHQPRQPAHRQHPARQQQLQQQQHHHHHHPHHMQQQQQLHHQAIQPPPHHHHAQHPSRQRAVPPHVQSLPQHHQHAPQAQLSTQHIAEPVSVRPAQQHAPVADDVPLNQAPLSHPQPRVAVPSDSQVVPLQDDTTPADSPRDTSPVAADSPADLQEVPGAAADDYDAGEEFAASPYSPVTSPAAMPASYVPATTPELSPETLEGAYLPADVPPQTETDDNASHRRLSIFSKMC